MWQMKLKAWLVVFMGPACFLKMAIEIPPSKVVSTHRTGTHPKQPLPTGYKGIPFIIGQGDFHSQQRHVREVKSLQKVAVVRGNSSEQI